MWAICPNCVGSTIARSYGDLDQGLDCRCLCKSEEVSKEQASIELISSNYTLGALQEKKSILSDYFYLVYNVKVGR